MLLSLFKLTMIVSLMISAVCIGTNERSSSEKDEAVTDSSKGHNAFLKEDAKSVDSHDAASHTQKRQSNKRIGYSNDRDPKIRMGDDTWMEHRVPRGGDKSLAHKMAKEALESPKMQETMKKLTKMSKPHGTLYASVKLPASARTSVEKSRREHQDRQSRRRKKKRKRHHRRYRNGHVGWPKGGGSSKRMSSTGRDINSPVKKLPRREKSLIKLNQSMTDKKSRDQLVISRPNERVTRVQVEDSDYVDFSSPLITSESSTLPSKWLKNEGSVKSGESQRMIDSLMRTTTRDPSKKNPRDQGIEYSDYYSEDDVLQDIAANKIPVQVVPESKYPNDRFARQTSNSASVGQIGRNVHQPYHRGRVAGRKDFRYLGNAVRSDRFQRYPKVKRFEGLNRYSRFLGADDSSSDYMTNYRLTDDRYDHLDPMYPVSTEQVPEQPEISEQEAVLDVIQNNLGASGNEGSNDEIHQQNSDPDSDQSNYLNQYDVPREDFRRLGANEPVEPHFSNSLELQNVENYQPMDTNLQQVENFKQNTVNQPRISSTTGTIVAQSQPSFSAAGSYDNLDMTQDQDVKSVSMQGINSPPQLYANNAMDQPLGKILESLGISVNIDSRDSNQNANSENIDNSDSFNQPEKHLLSPSYLKQEFKDEMNKNRNRAQLKKENKGSHFRRDSIQNGVYDNEFSPYTDDPLFSTHHTNISIAVQDTKEIANQILDTIMEELEELKLDQTKNSRREGSWSTAQAGIKLDMRVVNRSIIATVSQLAAPRFHGNLLNGTWNVSGHAPFKRGSPFVLIATDNCTKSIAVFVGACRICQGVDTIAGVWSVARQPKDCKDLQVATSVFNDIFRKTKLSSLKEHQNSTTTESVTTLKHEKRSS